MRVFLPPQLPHGMLAKFQNTIPASTNDLGSEDEEAHAARGSTFLTIALNVKEAAKLREEPNLLVFASNSVFPYSDESEVIAT